VEATIYYLNWDEEGQEHGPATELFHKYNVESVLEEDEKPPTEFSEDDFTDLYREITTLHRDIEEPSMAELEKIWNEWNNGSRQESEEFYNAEVRSMSIGDVVELDGTYYQVKSIGYEEIDVRGGM
jgi:hypothetical protein